MILLTPSETAQRLGISERTLRGLRRAGEIAYVALDARKIRHTESDIDEYLALRRRRDAPKGSICPSTSQKNRRFSTSISNLDVKGFTARQAAQQKG
jgi:excisionase family DNA binding protein